MEIVKFDKYKFSQNYKSFDAKLKEQMDMDVGDNTQEGSQL